MNPEQEYNQRLLAAYLAATSVNPTNTQLVKGVFHIYNEKWKPREVGFNCQGCVHRVFRNVKRYLQSQGLIENEEPK